MNRYLIRLLVVVAVVAVTGFARSSADDAHAQAVDVGQSNVQVAINVAVYCPDVTQSIDQFAVNIALVDIEGDVNEIAVDQTNVQIAYNLALYSPGATQLITQVAGNGTEVTTTSDAAVTIDQFNGAAAGSISFTSSGSYQTIVQAAANDALIATGSDTVSSAVGVAITQSNMAFALNVCFAGYILGSDEIPDEWEECAPEWWWGGGDAPEAWDAGWWEDDAPMTWEEWFEVWDDWWANGAPGWDACLEGAAAPDGSKTPSSGGSDSSSNSSTGPDSTSGASSTVGPTNGAGPETTGTTGANGQASSSQVCADDILAGNLPPLDGGFGTFSFGGCSFEQLLTTSGCDESTAAFFHNLPDGTFVVWVPGAAVEAVNEAILSLFSGETGIPTGTIFIARCS